MEKEALETSQRITQASEPKYLYHYTSIDSLLEIFKSKKLRLTDTWSTNDPLEDNLVIKALLNSRRIFKGFDGKSVASLLEEAQKNSVLFCLSFSESQNSALMHLAYNKGRGVCLKFEFEELKKWASQILVGGKTCSLEKVDYVNFESIKKDVDNCADDDGTEFTDLLIDSQKIKLRNWEKEKEWRVSIRQIVSSPDTAPVRFDKKTVEIDHEMSKSGAERLFYSFPFCLSMVKEIYLAPFCPMSKSHIKIALSLLADIGQNDFPIIDWFDFGEDPEDCAIDDIDDGVPSFKNCDELVFRALEEKGRK